MATRKSWEEILNFNRGDDWVAPVELERIERERRLAEEEAQRRAAREAAGVGADFTSVKSEASPFEETPEPSFVDRLGERLATGGRELANVAESVAGTVPGGIERMAGGAAFAVGDDPFVRDVMSFIPVVGGLTAPILDAQSDTIRAAGVGMINEGTERVEAARKVAGLDSMAPANRQATEAVLDVTGSLSSLLSIPGGIFGTIPMADAYAQEFARARMNNLTLDEARQTASLKGLAEGTSLIPAAKFIPGLGGIGDDVLKTSIDRFMIRTLATAAGEGTEESVTSMLQMGSDAILAKSAESERARQYAEKQLPADATEFWNNTWRAFRAGVVGGGAIGAPGAAYQVAAENGALVADMMNRTKDAREANPNAVPPTPDNSVTPSPFVEPVQTDMFGAPAEGAPTFNEQEAARQSELETDAAWQINTQQQGQSEREANRAALIESTRRRVDTARQRVEVIQDELEVDPDSPNQFRSAASPARLAELTAATRELRNAENDLGSMERNFAPAATVAPAPAPASPLVEPTQAELPLPAVAAPAAPRARAPKKAAPAPAPTPVSTDLPTPPSPEPPRTRRTVGQMLTGRDAVQTPKARIDTMRIALPNATDAELEAIMAEEDTVGPKGAIEALRSRLNAERPEQSDPLSVTQLVNKVAEGVGGDRRANTIAKLIGNGRVKIVADKSQLPDSKGNPVGQYHMKTGDIYIVANNVDPDNAVGDILSVLGHEFKHAGDLSYNPDLVADLGSFIGEERNPAINKKITALAKSGNRFAESAWKRAAAAAGFNPETADLTQLTPKQRAILNVELPAYFITEVVEARGSRGAATSAMNDIVSAVRTKYKSITGDADVNLDDVGYLARKLVESATRARGSLAIAEPDSDTGTDSLNMILPADAALGGERAAEDGRVYLDPVDNTRKFVISDADSSLTTNPTKIQQAKNDGVKLSQILTHNELYRNFPFLRDVVVNVLPDNLRGTAAVADVDENVISIGERFLTDASRGYPQSREMLRSILLHESQHFVQSKGTGSGGGSTPMFYTKEDIEEFRKYDRLARQFDRTAKDLIKELDVEVLRGEDPVDLAVQEANRYIDSGMRNAPPKVAELVNKLDGLTAQAEAQRKVTAAIDAEKMPMYEAIQGEREAYWTQANMNKPLEAMPINPTAVNAARGGLADVNVGPFVTRRSPKGGLRLVNSEGTPLNARLQTLEMARTPRDTRAAAFNKKKDSAVGDLFGSLFRWHGGLGKEMGDKFLESVGEAAMFSHRAMNAHSNIGKAVDEVSKRALKSGGFRGTRVKNMSEAREAVDKHLQQRLAAIEQLPSAGRRESALGSLARDYPEFEVVTEAYHQINQLTKTLVSQMLEANPNPTAGEVKLMETMLDRTFQYSTRLYAAFQGKTGAVYAKRLRDYYDSAKTAQVKGKNMNAREKEAFDAYTGAMQFLIDNDLNIPDTRKGFDEIKTDQLDNLYSTWVDSTPAARLRLRNAYMNEGFTAKESEDLAHEKMIEDLMARKPGTEEYESKALALADEIIGLTNTSGAISNYYRGFKEDRTILMRREFLPEEMRKLLGEIQDPATRLAITISKQGELAARMKLLLNMRDSGLVVKANEAGLEGTEGYTETLSGEGYGPLNGYKTTPRVYKAIQDGMDMASGLEQSISTMFIQADGAIEKGTAAALGAIRAGASTMKAMSIIAEGFSMGMNALGSPIMLLPQGLVSPKAILSGINTSMEAIGDVMFDAQGKISPAFERAIKYGAIDSARAQEIRSTPHKYIRQLIDREAVLGEKRTKAKAAAVKGKNLMVETFVFTDAWTKVVAFENNINLLRKFYEAEGVTKTDEEIYSEAGSRTKSTTISWTRSMPITRAMERTGLTTFMVYFQEVPRSLAIAGWQGLVDLSTASKAKTTKGKLIMATSGLSRIAGTIAATKGIEMALTAAAAAINGEDEEKVRKMALALRPDVRFAAPILVGENEKGEPLLFRAARLDPYGPINDLIRIMADPDLDLEDSITRAFHQIGDMAFMNRFTKEVWTMATGFFTDENIKDRTTRLERMFPKGSALAKDLLFSTGMNDHVVNSAVATIDTLTPGIMDAFDPSNPEVTKAKGDKFDALATMVRSSGGRLDKADPGSYAYELGAEVKEARDVGRKRVDEAVVADSSIERIQRLINESDNEVHERMLKLRDLYVGMTEGLDMSPREAMKVLKDSASLTDVDVANIRRGKLSQDPSPEEVRAIGRTLSKASLEARGKNRERSNSTEKQKEEEARLKEVMKVLKSLGYKEK